MFQVPLLSVLLEALRTHYATDPTAPAGHNEGAGFNQTHRHPIARNIAAAYEVAYDQVMEWFSSGSSFEDILLALETGRLSELSVEDLLERSAEVSWEQLWEETRPAGPNAV